MRSQNPKSPSRQSKSKSKSKSKQLMGSAESELKAVTTHQFRQPSPLSTGGVAPTRSGGSSSAVEGGCCGRERLKKHWVEVSGRVWIPDIWGQEDLLEDWIDSSAFDSGLIGSSIASARESLAEDGRRASSTRFGIENSC